MNTKSLKQRILLLITITAGLLFISGCASVTGWIETKAIPPNKEKLALTTTDDSSLDARLVTINNQFWAVKESDVDGARATMKQVIEKHKESKTKVKEEATAAADKGQGMTKEEKKALREKEKKEAKSVQISDEARQMYMDGKAQFIRGWKGVSEQSKAISQIIDERDQAIDNALGLRKPQSPSYSLKKDQYKQAYDEYRAALKRYNDQRSKGLSENSAAKRIQAKYAPASDLSFAILRESTSMIPTALRMIRFGTANKIDVSDLEKLMDKSDKEVQKMEKKNRAGDDEE